jgi:hypothetical protein
VKRLTPFEFIAKATVVHGNKYDYSKITHVYASENVTIICKEHNYEFQQRPSKHLSGFGCNLCSGKKKRTTDEFIKEAKEIHCEKYTYDKVNYLNRITNVVITCRVHGDFEQQPKYHLKGFGCSRCSGKAKKTTNEFIQKAKEVHGEKYTYDRTEYINGEFKLTITCNKHGDFLQIPESHLQGRGCPKCGGSQKLATNDFINRAKEIHNNKYNYDKVNYINSQTKVSIGCQIHGYFEQIPKTHLEGSGCTECSRSSSKKLISEEFIEKAKKVHGDEYDYDNVIYVHSKSKINITCRSHGDFKQVPNNHLQGQGCPLCSGFEHLTTERFIEKAKKIHGDQYEYNKVSYVNIKNEVIITCRFHGDFNQVPDNHLRGQGCRSCRISRGELKIQHYLKRRDILFEEQYTFGDCIDKRQLPFDFAIFFNNKIGLIEYQGEQHYKKVNFGGKDILIESIKKRDEIKAAYAKRNGIPLLLISHLEFDEIEKIIEKFVEGNFSKSLVK